VSGSATSALGRAGLLGRRRVCHIALALAPALALAGRAFAAQDVPGAGEDSAGPDWSVGCDVGTAVRTSIVTLSDTGAVPVCIVVGQGDLVKWVNPSGIEISVGTSDDLLASEDLSETFDRVVIPAQGEATVRVIHAGRVDYSAPEFPLISGTILVLGRGAG
jgi:hypothetical protein